MKKKYAALFVSGALLISNQGYENTGGVQQIQGLSAKQIR